TIQNDTRGTTAIGGNGGNLGVNTITPSFSFCLNIFANNTRGFCWATNGVKGAPPYTATGAVNLASGDPIQVTLVYANGTITATTISIVNGMNQVTVVNDRRGFYRLSLPLP